MRVPLIIVWVSLLEIFHWMIYAFGAFLIFIQQQLEFLFKKRGEYRSRKNIAVLALKKIMPVDVQTKNDKFQIRKNGILGSVGSKACRLLQSSGIKLVYIYLSDTTSST